MKNKDIKVTFTQTHLKVGEKEEITVKKPVQEIEMPFDLSFGEITNLNSGNSKKFLLQINYREAEKTHREVSGIDNCRPYAQVAHEIADEFMQEKNLVLGDHLVSWPTFQAIVHQS